MEDFEEWWEDERNNIPQSFTRKQIAQAAWQASREQALAEVSAIPLRAMFDEGYERGRIEALAEAVEVSKSFGNMTPTYGFEIATAIEALGGIDK